MQNIKTSKELYISGDLKDHVVMRVFRYEAIWEEFILDFTLVYDLVALTSYYLACVLKAWKFFMTYELKSITTWQSEMIREVV